MSPCPLVRINVTVLQIANHFKLAKGKSNFRCILRWLLKKTFGWVVIHYVGCIINMVGHFEGFGMSTDTTAWCAVKSGIWLGHYRCRLPPWFLDKHPTPWSRKMLHITPETAATLPTSDRFPTLVYHLGASYASEVFAGYKIHKVVVTSFFKIHLHNIHFIYRVN